MMIALDLPIEQELCWQTHMHNLCANPAYQTILNDLKNALKNKILSAIEWSLLDLQNLCFSLHDYDGCVCVATTRCQYYYLNDTPSAMFQARDIGIFALSLAQQVGLLEYEAILYEQLALIALHEGRSKDAHDHLLDAMALCEDLNKPYQSAQLTRWYAEHLAALGAAQEAQQAYQIAINKYAALNAWSLHQQCQQDLQQLYTQRI